MDEDETPALDTLLGSFLQNADDREQGLQELVQQQKADLHALHHGLEQSTGQQHKQQACFNQMQVRLCKHLLYGCPGHTDQAAVCTLENHSFRVVAVSSKLLEAEYQNQFAVLHALTKQASPKHDVCISTTYNCSGNQVSSYPILSF